MIGWPRETPIVSRRRPQRTPTAERAAGSAALDKKGHMTYFVITRIDRDGLGHSFKLVY